MPLAITVNSVSSTTETWISLAEVDIVLSWGTTTERFRGSWRYFDTTTPPTGWTVASGTGKFVVGEKQTAGARVEINLPGLADEKKGREGAKEVTVKAEADGKEIGVVKIKVELRKKALPE